MLNAAWSACLRALRHSCCCPQWSHRCWRCACSRTLFVVAICRRHLFVNFCIRRYYIYTFWTLSTSRSVHKLFFFSAKLLVLQFSFGFSDTCLAMSHLEALLTAQHQRLGKTANKAPQMTNIPGWCSGWLACSSRMPSPDTLTEFNSFSKVFRKTFETLTNDRFA